MWSKVPPPHDLDENEEKQAEDMLEKFINIKSENLRIFLFIQKQTSRFSLMEDILVCFSSYWHAEYFFEISKDARNSNLEIISISLRDISKINLNPNSEKINFITLNPCPICGVLDKYPIDIIMDAEQLQYYWKVDSSFRFAKFQRYINMAQEQIVNKNFKQAILILQTIHQHIDPGIIEVWEKIAICSKELDWEETYQDAMKKIDKIFQLL